VKWVLALLALVCLTGARNPMLVTDVSQREIAVVQGFTGAELVLFGAILKPDGTRATKDYDIVVVLKGPVRPLVLREKRKVGGVWMNADSTTLRTVPSFYAMVSSRPIHDIVDARRAGIYEMGLESLQLSPSGRIDPARQVHFAQGLVDMMRRAGLYSQDEHGVLINGQVLYQAHIRLPSSVRTGVYTAQTFAISRGRVVASSLARVTVNKQGMERAVEDFAQDHALAYGLLAVALAVGMGWLAGRVFALI